YSGKAPLQPLTFQILNNSVEAKRWHHPFIPIGDFFSVSENKAAATQEEVLLALGRHAKSPLEVHFIASTEAEEKGLTDRLQKSNIPVPQNTHFHLGYLSSGFVLEDAQIALLPLAELNHRLKPRRQKWRNTYHTPASDFHE